MDPVEAVCRLFLRALIAAMIASGILCLVELWDWLAGRLRDRRRRRRSADAR